MDYLNQATNTQYGFSDIRAVLIAQLQKSRQQSPELFSKEIYVLPAINSHVEDQLKHQLQEEREIHTDKRILLILCCIDDLHWVGVLIEFQAADHIVRAEYIDPVSGSNVIDHSLQEQLAEVYPSAVFQLKDGLKHADQKCSSVLTIKNLLNAVGNNQHSSIPTSITSNPISGTTGAGKSTTIQFLSGAKMKEVQVEISPGIYLQHVTAVGSIKNPDLKNVVSSPLQKSETRYIAPVTVQLKDVLGPHESGVITFCDAPGFGDTAGPEVDIANSIGVIEALKGTKSVKLLALSSYKSLGDRGQGIQKLAHILISMVHGIEDKLDAIYYAFTKYPEKTDIHALLLSIKTDQVDGDATLQSDIVFVKVLKDMIRKTKKGADKISPTTDSPKELIENLMDVRGIMYPAEVFRFSMSEETRATISDHVQRDKFSIICAMKHKDIDLVLYYLDDLQILNDLMKESFIRDIYKESVRFVSESIDNHSIEIKEKFNRLLASQDGLQRKDIIEYESSMKYLEHAQILKKHLGTSLLSPAALIQNIITKLNEIDRSLNEVELHSPFVTIYLDNLQMLKDSFVELKENYNSSCKKFQKHFNELVQNARDLIPNNNFTEIAEILLNIFQSARALEKHLHEQVQKAYSNTVKDFLKYLNSYSEKAGLVLAKVRLNSEEVETIKNYMEILRSARENATVQEHVLRYLKLSKKEMTNSNEHEPLEENIKSLNGIYNEFIVKIINYFNEINVRIKQLFERNGDQALEHIKSLVDDMDAIRIIPELESKTAGTYYQTIENISSYMREVQADAEKLLSAIDQQRGITNFKYLSRSLARLKNAGWINQISPGAYDNLMLRIKDELVQYASQLQKKLIKTDFSLKCPDNVPVAMEIVQKIESMRDLERSVPELEKYRKEILERFSKCTQDVFDRIQKSFDLQDKVVYQTKKQLKELEEIKRQYENVHPARVFLKNQGYTDIDMLNNEIEEVKTKQKVQHELKATVECAKENEPNRLHKIVTEYANILHTPKGLIENLSNKILSRSSNYNVEADAYLQDHGYDRIELVYEQITQLDNKYDNDIQRIQDEITELNKSLCRLESIKKEHDSLLTTRHSSSEETSFILEKEFNSYDSLDYAIQERTQIINERRKSKQIYHFTGRMDASMANNAIVYIIQCEKVNHDSIRESVMDVNENLDKYVREYGDFLKKQINEKFNYVRNANSEGGPFIYSQDLEICLQELSSFSRFPHVFERINAAETIEKLHQEFLDFHRNLNAKMEEYKVSGKLKELKDQLIIAQALTCVDRFCVNVFAGNGFAALYKQYQGEIYRECKVAYRTVLDYISKGDYANADIVLSDIENNPLNQKDKTQITHDLQCSLNKLMKDTRSIVNWLDGKIEREDNRIQITQIKENIDKIRIACNKNSIIELLDGNLKENLRAFESQINDILAEIILRGLGSIEAFMEADSFSETEQGMETLSQVQRELAGYCTSDNVQKKSKELRSKLDDIVNGVLERTEISNINQFSINPPKDLLAKLKAVAAHGSARFTQAYTLMLAKTRQTFSLAIEDVRKAPLNERSAKISSLNYALCFLPDDLQMQFKQQIDELNKLIEKEKEEYKQELVTSVVTVDDDEHGIMKIRHLAERYSKQNMPDFLKRLREECIKKLQMYRTNIQKSLDEQNIQSAIDITKKIIKYEEHLGDYISEIKAISENIRVLMIKRLSNCCDTLSNISSIEQTSTLEKAFTDIIIYLEFSNTLSTRIEEFFPNEIMQNIREAFRKVSEYLINNSEKFQSALKDMNPIKLYETMLISKKWQTLLDTVSRCSLNHNLVQNFLKEMKKIISYKSMISELEQMIDNLKSQLNVEFITDETIRFEAERDDLFNNLRNILSILKNIDTKFKDVLLLPIDMDTFEKNIKEKIEKITSQLMGKASKAELLAKDADDFRTYYNHLASFDKYIHLSGLNVKQILDDSQEKILEKIRPLKKEIKESNYDVSKLSSTLIKIKFFAENLSMFEKYINDEIDDVLQHYKQSQGPVGIASLSVELEKTDIGARLISEHSSLSGEDWRRRREKMQKQDDLEYLIEKLTGTDLAKENLRLRYCTFKKTYDELLSNFLKLLTQNNKKEPDLEILISETRRLTSTVTKTSNSVTWTQHFKDDIPTLLAYIFAIWTLKNTQHYNTMRGIDESKSYLLMPHVGQVIAIFRLLGLGYEIEKKDPLFGRTYSKKASDDLVNNLVEVGTGEGKSVILAITACVFALTGVDVNCSCYSEVLSTRDKNDFASVFRALGIEERIEYGTFNKLCEQLLNEQCNVREKVCDMIVTNKKQLDVTDTSSCRRSKVLLIDEVDVFLSDKYYGGMYIPSVYLKDPSIKALLDSIWQNKTLRSLNSVKVLPTYQACVAKYSNWIFLFDEAIKDMLAALQSYQSSTYIVQNDKIVYVEGESIVDNVVRGYDTVWAYYHENEKGSISHNSLNENVGILINCGTFSYAEMPHDFAYIGGVTGTLTTLAKVEKKILKDVYVIDKMTYMPSVFGSTNRSYNPMTDVRVILDESEYFMEIFGEIQRVCNVDRAILVFFESEDKLIEFYNSKELSTRKQDVQIIMEKVAVKDRELCVKRAATIGKVTLLTRTFGRGTDFICRNQDLLLNGGIHVLQSFFSEELSEEYQIMGRGARQGDRGSYRMILLGKDLEWVVGPSWKEDLSRIMGDKLYDTLNRARSARYESKCGAKELGIAQCKAEHKASKEFMNALMTGDIDLIKTFLAKQNQGANIVADSSRTVLLMDATGSMSSLLSAAKETVCTMFERASIVLAEKGLPDDAFQMQFVIYRDYDCKEDGILQSSSWETKPSNLRNFMTKVTAMGGGDYEEAIEIGLWHAVQQSEQPEELSQVILIGDAPAKDTLAINRDRNATGGDAYWSKTKYKTPTHYITELEKLKVKDIPVHAFYLHAGAEKNFRKIASETLGRCEPLNINSPQGAEKLTQFVTEEVLRISAGDEGDEVVALYRANIEYISIAMQI
ncbi:unnamed protein product [Adineta steineri]|uniref:SecA family profile domain-containing protein n=1 Tax=Adineta steineri TaxID=433720 RepID=A0A814PW67_9BILA|nr:unnamed protein product [Adineta steineri]CAF1111817.1 unnamed protein product [Adineta steineri]